MLTKEDLKKAREAHDQASAEADLIRKNADQARAELIAKADAQGMAQKDIIEATGYSRETVRRITREGQRAFAESEESS